MNMKYAGIGSRATPLNICKMIRGVAKELAERGFVCHTGGALGSDKAFIDGAESTENPAELWLPWQGYNGYRSSNPDLQPAHLEFTKKYHPAWGKCSIAAKSMHARNAQILLGDDLKSPVDFVVCWTNNGDMTGGTAQGLRIAIDYDIPIFNLGKSSDTINRLYDFLNKTK